MHRNTLQAWLCCFWSVGCITSVSLYHNRQTCVGFKTPSVAEFSCNANRFSLLSPFLSCLVFLCVGVNLQHRSTSAMDHHNFWALNNGGHCTGARLGERHAMRVWSSVTRNPCESWGCEEQLSHQDVENTKGNRLQILYHSSLSQLRL